MLLFTHCTTLQGTTLPCTVSVNPGLPAAAEFGVIELSVGVGSAVVGVESVKGNELDAPSEFVTVTPTLPGFAASAAGMEAVSSVALTKVVVCAAPLQFTTASLVKFVPVTVSAKPWELQYGVEAAEVVDAESEVITGGFPGVVLIVKRTIFDTSVVVVLFTFDVAD